MSIKKVMFESLAHKVQADELHVGTVRFERTNSITIELVELPSVRTPFESKPDPEAITLEAIQSKDSEGHSPNDKRIYFRGKQGRKEIAKVILDLLPVDPQHGMKNPEIAEAVVKTTGKKVGSQFVHSVMKELQKQGKVIEVTGNKKVKFRWIKKPDFSHSS